ncbi:MAG: response regulator transcription factor [Alphaproteobacteria bacterium]|nr:response regulator transcription factor [Alphaproteobacteria bacterium]MBU2271456.1 response regulator transcription factor [Alphaproteobacteria bacterium]MBU2417692.1 response regulator transcription factor [Alphaproteobacteria bacterium]
MDRIIVADDHPLFRAALGSALARAAPGAVVEETPSLAGAREALARGPVDLLLLDLRLSDSEGFAGLAGVRSDYPTVPVVVVSASEDAATIARALAFGAAGFIPKSATLAQMIEALEAIRAGDNWAPTTADAATADAPEAEPMEARIASLTPSQLRILIGLQEGRLNKQIAFDLGVTEATIKAHLTGVFRKLGVQNRTQAVIAARALSVGA